jgi:hypothetical protein
MYAQLIGYTKLNSYSNKAHSAACNRAKQSLLKILSAHDYLVQNASFLVCLRVFELQQVVTLAWCRSATLRGASKFNNKTMT